MSVQVKRRREASTFLTSFVGAPAELIVDTTNNRVQVHDGATAGGWAAAKLAEVPAMARGFVSKFRNGGMNVAQRGTSGSVTAGATTYTLDGWQVTATGAACIWSQQYAVNIVGHALRLSVASGLTSVSVQQRIESFVAAQLMTDNGSPQPVTVHFCIFNATGAPLMPQIATFIPTAQDNFASLAPDLAATNLQPIASNAFGIVAYTFTPSASLANGYQVELLLGGALNASSGYVDIGRADLRATPALAVGLTSTPPVPELRPFGVELEYCQRYFCKTFPQAVTPSNAAGLAGAIPYIAIVSGVAYFGIWWPFPMVMRTTPTLSFFNPINNNNKWYDCNASADSGSPLLAYPTGDRGAYVFNIQVAPDLQGYTIMIHATATAEL